MSQVAKQTREEYLKQWRAENREHLRAYKRKWRAENKEKVDAANRRYWEKKLKQAQ